MKQRKQKLLAYKELVKKIKMGRSRENIWGEISELCEKCQPSSPIVCVELCQIWRLKREFRDLVESQPKLEPAGLLSLIRNSRRVKILEILIENPCSLSELQDRLKATGCCHSLSILRNHYIEPLVDAGFIKEEEDLYRVTPQGNNMCNILIKGEIAKLPFDFKEQDEKILAALALAPKSYDELAKVVPRVSLYRALKRLQRRELIAKSNLSGHIFYFKTKPRPTRRLSPTEMRIFKALPKEGITVKDLGVRVGVSVRRLYRYLRQLRYKWHVRKGKKTALYYLTDSGRSSAQALNMVHSLFVEEASEGYSLFGRKQFL